MTRKKQPPRGRIVGVEINNQSFIPAPEQQPAQQPKKQQKRIRHTKNRVVVELWKFLSEDLESLQRKLAQMRREVRNWQDHLEDIARGAG